MELFFEMPDNFKLDRSENYNFYCFKLLPNTFIRKKETFLE